MRRQPLSVLVVTPVVTVLALAVGLSGCGQAATASTSTVLNLEGTNYVTIPPTPSTTPTTTRNDSAERTSPNFIESLPAARAPCAPA